MGFAILRMQKLKAGIAVKRSLMHAFREQTTPNADADQLAENTHIGANNVSEAMAKFKDRLPEKVRKNGVLAVEYLITGSPADMHEKSRDDQDAYFKDALEWLQAKHGVENVIYAGIHRDEQTPHMYAYVVPIDERGKLNCRAFFGEPKALNKMQTDFWEKVGQNHGLERGIEGSKARHTTIKQYYANISAEYAKLPEIETPAPIPPGEKPGLLASKKEKEEWTQASATYEAQQKKHLAEVEERHKTAVAIVEKHEAEARHARELKAQNTELKKSNSHYTHLAQDLKAKAAKVDLFTPAELQAAEERQRKQVADMAARTAENARQAAVATEQAHRIEALPKLLDRAGADLCFGQHATTALARVSGDASKIDWKAVEAVAMVEAIARHGQTPENVATALLTHSPARSDPTTHAELLKTISLRAPLLEDRYQKTQEKQATHLSYD